MRDKRKYFFKITTEKEQYTYNNVTRKSLNLLLDSFNEFINDDFIVFQDLIVKTDKLDSISWGEEVDNG